MWTHVGHVESGGKVEDWNQLHHHHHHHHTHHKHGNHGGHGGEGKPIKDPMEELEEGEGGEGRGEWKGATHFVAGETPTGEGTGGGTGEGKGGRGGRGGGNRFHTRRQSLHAFLHVDDDAPYPKGK